MPSVLDAPEFVEHLATDDRPIQGPHAGGARLGFWRRLAQSITPTLTSTPRERHALVCPAHRPFETPMDRFGREYPSLSVYALALV